MKQHLGILGNGGHLAGGVDFSPLRLPQAGQEGQGRGLTGTVLPHQGQNLAGVQGKGQSPEHRLPRGVAEPDILAVQARLPGRRFFCLRLHRGQGVIFGIALEPQPALGHGGGAGQRIGHTGVNFHGGRKHGGHGVAHPAQGSAHGLGRAMAQ